MTDSNTGRVRSRPNWLLFYAALPLEVGLLWVEHQIILPTWAHQLVQIGIVLLTFCLLRLWMGGNQGAIESEQIKRVVLMPMVEPMEDDRPAAELMTPTLSTAENPTRRLLDYPDPVKIRSN